MEQQPALTGDDAQLSGDRPSQSTLLTELASSVRGANGHAVIGLGVGARPAEDVGNHQALIKLSQVTRSYAMGHRRLYALWDVSLEIYPGEFVAIVGPSGSGKSTLLNLIGGIDKPDEGDVFVDRFHVNVQSENALSKWRGKAIGIVFQFFQLLPTLTALENVMLPMELRGTFANHRRERASAALERVGLKDRADQLPSELSGGEQQRVAIARALANDPPILLADEPTGNLDSETGQRIVELLGELNRAGKTIVLVTHEETLARAASRIVHVRDGHLAEAVP